MTTIDYATAKARIEAVAKARPEHTTGAPGKTCHYFEPDGSPSCIVGAAFEPELRAAGVGPDHEINDEGVYALVEGDILDLTVKARYFLEAAQGAQDLGDVWLSAFEEAVERYDTRLTEDGEYIFERALAPTSL